MGYLSPRSASVTLDGSGNGQVSFSIDNTNQRWVVDAVRVITSQAAATTPIPRAVFYKNVIALQGFEGGTNSGNFDTATGRIILYPDDILYCVWSGGIPGNTATATIDGTFDPAGVPLTD